MKITKKIFEQFNRPDTLLVVSSFPLLEEEIAQRNAVSRYTYLLLKNFPKNKKVVVVCETVTGQDNNPYLLGKNILVVPTYEQNNSNLFSDLNRVTNKFHLVNDVLIQFEFSLFGKELITFLLPFFFMWQKLKGKKIYTMFHQVVTDLSTLSGQVNLEAKTLKTFLINVVMKLFYLFFGLANEKVLVHDQFLADKLTGLVSKNKLEIIPHGINGYKRFTQNKVKALKKQWGLNKNDQVVLAYGYHSWYKGTDWLAKNFLQMKADGLVAKNCKLVLAGDVAPTQKNNPQLFSFYKNLHQLIRNNKDIIHTGFVPEDKVAEVFAISDLVVFPYRSRMSSSGALALALQYRKPIICSNYFVENLSTDLIRKFTDSLGINSTDYSFAMSYTSFVKVFSKVWHNSVDNKKMSKLGKLIANSQDWQVVGSQYLAAMDNAKNTYNLSNFASFLKARFEV